MVFDGEWRTAFIRREHPTLPYATAPFPSPTTSRVRVGPRRRHDRRHPQGHQAPAGGVGPREVPGDGHELPGHARKRARERADDGRLGQLARSSTWGRSSRRSSKIWNNPNSSFYPPLLPSGAGYAQLADDFDAKWQAGNVPNLQQGLQQLDTNIDNQLQQGETP